ncbi:MAG TPA: UbiD family decarboxylase [Chloroflexota bacterium]|nr:UbiD family decarboxylase [Chloroflexota bacterium]
MSSLRDLLARLDREGELCHVTAPVDRTWEIAAVMRKVLSFPADQRPALLFENVQGFESPLLVGLYTNRRRYAKALGLSTNDEVNERWREALDHPLPVQEVQGGPCKEVVLTGDNASIDSLPLARWTPDKDAGLFFTSQAVITREPGSDYVNVGTYRMQYRSRNETNLFVNPAQHVGMIFGQYEARGERMPVAVAIGADPAVTLVAPAKIPYGMSELEVAGALMGRPLEVTRGETVDLLVPASAEIVLEGYLEPGSRSTEGPFGEFAGVLSKSYDMPVFHITAVTHRRKPILQSFVSQKAPSESSLLRSVVLEALTLRTLRGLGIPAVAAHVPESGAAWYHFVVSIKKMHPAHPRMVMNAIWAAMPALAKRIVVVDEDVEPADAFQVEMAVATCVQPARDLTILEGYMGQIEDPSPTPGQEHMSSKLGVDATRKHPYPPVALPEPHYMQRVEDRWEEYGIKPLGD